MSRYKYLLFFLLSMGYLCSVSQYYHSAAVYDAFGPVKEIKTSSENSIVKKKVKFDKQGRGGVPFMMYNDDGFPVGYEMNMLAKQNYQKLFWNEENRLDSVAFYVGLIGGCSAINAKNHYNSDKEVKSQTITVSTDKDTVTYLRTFCDYVYDDNGSWTSRFVRQTETNNAGIESTEEYTETRTIKYYPPSN